MMSIGYKITETEKAYKIVALGYDGLLHMFWLPKSIVHSHKKTIEEIHGEVWSVPPGFVKKFHCTNQIFIVEWDDFIDLYNIMLDDALPLFNEEILSFEQVTKLPGGEAFVERGIIPFRAGKYIILLRQDQIISFDPITKRWKIKINKKDVVERKMIKEYKSFTFILNGKLYEWHDGKIIVSEDD